MNSPYILLDDQVEGAVRLYDKPVKIIEAHRINEVETAFEDVQSCHEQGLYIAGYASYELGYALEPKLRLLMPEALQAPLLQFGVFETYQETSFTTERKPANLKLQPAWTLEDYAERFHRVIAYIKAGDVYQINLTFPIEGTCSKTAYDLYASLRHRQPGRYGGIISLGGPDIISLSPELFFQTSGRTIHMRPMKGTARRQADPVQDAALRDAMKVDQKSRAENLMIVDLLRNDVSRIAEPRSVKVPELFALETYPTLHQMTSLVQAKIRHGTTLRDIFQSLFPCGSITGAPKIRAIEIIHELEGAPRGPYCGAMGYLDPDGESCFNVAIRTMTLKDETLIYSVGGGLVLDSQATDEYNEALLKAKVLSSREPELIETLRWVPDAGGLRSDLHLARMERSAKALGYAFSRKAFLSALGQIEANTAQRVRLILNSNGKLTCETTDFEPVIKSWTVAMSKNPLTGSVQETRYKVSERSFYDGERRRIQTQTNCDEVIFFNDKAELCEGSFTSIFIKKGGDLLTPELSSGLLPGVLREELLSAGEAREASLGYEDLIHADSLYVGNSLRGLIEAKLVDHNYH